MHGSKLHVGNLDYSVTKQDLEDLFSSYGEVKDTKLIERRGIAFVEMSKQLEAEAAKKELNGSDFKGRNLKVNEAQPPRKRKYGRR